MRRVAVTNGEIVVAVEASIIDWAKAFERVNIRARTIKAFFINPPGLLW